MTPHHIPGRLAGSDRISEVAAVERPRRDRIAKYLVGAATTTAELPPLTDLLAVLLALAEGTRRKAILPLASSTGEFAFVRRDDHVLVSYYDGGPIPQVFVRDRAIDLPVLVEATADAVIEHGQHAGRSDPSASDAGAAVVVDDAGLAMAERARRSQLKPAPWSTPSYVQRRGGAQVAPPDAPLAFGFSIKLASGEGPVMESGTRADVHALLFDGELWGFVHGRKLSLVRGPVFPAVARMVNMARAVVDACEARRPVNLKLKAGDFGIALRIGRDGEARLTLVGSGGPTRKALTVPALDLSSALLPILRIAGELVRTVVATDRSQSKNLRLSALRDEVRALRRIVRTRGSQKSFVNREPELLRASASASQDARDVAPSVSSGKLRMSPRWHAEVEGLDASSTYLCGDRIVIATSRNQLALSRDDGQLLWMRECAAAATYMTGTSLLCLSPDGELTLSDLEDGQVFARTRIAPRVGGPMLGMFAGARGAPPIAVLTEGRDRLVAVDTRTGAQRWRFRSPGRADFKMTRAGRVLLVVSGDTTLDAIDVASGEVAWRWSDVGRLSLQPTITRDHAIAIASQGDNSALLSFDLFSGQLAFRKPLEHAPGVSPIATEQLAIVCGDRLSAFDLHDGSLRWQADDPGLADGAAALVVDQQLVINTPSGVAQSLDVDNGTLRWQHRLADPSRDDVPRRLEPVLRGGALFLPSASVHVVRPADGSLIGGPIAERIIPDFMRIDERGWLYVAEESGLIEAHAPVPTLRLVK